MKFQRDQSQRDAASNAFSEEGVALCYYLRPPYPPDVFNFLLDLAPKHDRMLDIGSGHGKIAVSLADRFKEVYALEPSLPMINVGRAADNGRHCNITWINKKVEDFESDLWFDIVTAGSSIHWPDHSIMFPKLAKWTDTLAAISGDDPVPPPCGDEAWDVFLRRWLGIMANHLPELRRPYDPAGMKKELSRYEKWMDISGRRKFSFIFPQKVEDFVESQHSRATWSRSSMGTKLAGEFDQELIELMLPFARDGYLQLSVVSEAVWGTPLTSPKSDPDHE